MDKPQMGQTFMIVGPSGVGKNTLINGVKQKHEFGQPVSFTTRAPKKGEQEGRENHFTNENDFLSRVSEGFFAEYARVHGNLYGTPLHEVIRFSSSGKHTIFDLDIQGAKQLKLRFPSFHMIFIVPPSMTELRRRIMGRNGGESPEQIELRLKNAVDEMHQADIADWLIENNHIDQATSFLYNLVLQLGNGEKPSMVRYHNTHLMKRCLSASLD